MDQLLQAARVVFETAGYFDTRVADIVTEAGVSHGTFYTYFESKDDVLRALVDELVEDTYAASEISLNPELGAFEQLETSIRQFMVTYRQRAPMHRILEQVASFSESFLTVRLAIRNRFTQRIQASIESRQERNLCDPGVDAVHTAHALGGMVEDFAYALYVLRQSLDEEAAVISMTQVWARAVGIEVPRQARPGQRVVEIPPSTGMTVPVT